MRYLYECQNNSCKEFEKKTTVEKPMAESKKLEKCKECDREMNRIYSSVGIQTMDGIKF